MKENEGVSDKWTDQYVFFFKTYEVAAHVCKDTSILLDDIKSIMIDKINKDIK